MKSYLLTYDVLKAVGTQSFRVLANSEKEAIEKFNKGHHEFIEEIIETQELSEEPISIEDEGELE